MISEKKLKKVIGFYRESRAKAPDYCIELCKKQHTLAEAVKIAALCLDTLQGKRHSHQHRISRKALYFYMHNLLANLNRIEAVNCFDELYSIAEECWVLGIGLLTTYDVAHRIGEFLNIHPDKIYLHRGTRIGAELLIGRIKERAIDRKRLPKVLSESDLTCAELEDLLCIFKNDFNGQGSLGRCGNIKPKRTGC